MNVKTPGRWVSGAGFVDGERGLYRGRARASGRGCWMPYRGVFGHGVRHMATRLGDMLRS